VDLSGIPWLRPAPPVELMPSGDPDFVRASEWLARASAEPEAIVLGAPYGGASISGARCDLTPAAVRAALSRFSVWSSDKAVSVEQLAVLDAGDVEPAADPSGTQNRIAEAIAALRARAEVPIVLIGGDNSVTVGGARGVAADGLLTFDAHHDCRDPAHGVTNGSPVRQLVQGGLAHVVQVGIHGFANSEANARWALDHKIHTISAVLVREEGMGRAVAGARRMLGDARRVWVDVDLDVLDRAYAPGTAASMPGGLLPWHLEEAAFLLGLDRGVAGLDLTEVDPSMDVGETTVRTACAVLLAYLAGVRSR